jgi:hypothetical protein
MLLLFRLLWDVLFAFDHLPARERAGLCARCACPLLPRFLAGMDHFLLVAVHTVEAYIHLFVTDVTEYVGRNLADASRWAVLCLTWPFRCAYQAVTFPFRLAHELVLKGFRLLRRSVSASISAFFAPLIWMAAPFTPRSQARQVRPWPHLHT